MLLRAAHCAKNDQPLRLRRSRSWPSPIAPLQPRMSRWPRPCSASTMRRRALSIFGYLVAVGAAYAFAPREAGVPRALAVGGTRVRRHLRPAGAWYDLVRIDSVWLGSSTLGLWA